MIEQSSTTGSLLQYFLSRRIEAEENFLEANCFGPKALEVEKTKPRTDYGCECCGVIGKEFQCPNARHLLSNPLKPKGFSSLTRFPLESCRQYDNKINKTSRSLRDAFVRLSTLCDNVLQPGKDDSLSMKQRRGLSELNRKRFQDLCNENIFLDSVQYSSLNERFSKWMSRCVKFFQEVMNEKRQFALRYIMTRRQVMEKMHSSVSLASCGCNQEVGELNIPFKDDSVITGKKNGICLDNHDNEIRQEYAEYNSLGCNNLCLPVSLPRTELSFLFFKRMTFAFEKWQEMVVKLPREYLKHAREMFNMAVYGKNLRMKEVIPLTSYFVKYESNSRDKLLTNESIERNKLLLLHTEELFAIQKGGAVSHDETWKKIKDQIVCLSKTQTVLCNEIKKFRKGICSQSRLADVSMPNEGPFDEPGPKIMTQAVNTSQGTNLMKRQVVGGKRNPPRDTSSGFYTPLIEAQKYIPEEGKFHNRIPLNTNESCKNSSNENLERNSQFPTEKPLTFPYNPNFHSDNFLSAYIDDEKILKNSHLKNFYHPQNISSEFLCWRQLKHFEIPTIANLSRRSLRAKWMFFNGQYLQLKRPFHHCSDPLCNVLDFH